jgi:hypothetical protein
LRTAVSALVKADKALDEWEDAHASDDERRSLPFGVQVRFPRGQ